MENTKYASWELHSDFNHQIAVYSGKIKEKKNLRHCKQVINRSDIAIFM
jgi:hypothetical protein